VSRRRDDGDPIPERALDRLLTGELARSFPGAAPDALALARLASAATGSGHSALALREAASLLAWPEARLLEARAALSDWSAVGKGETGRPLVLDGADRLYLRRYHAYERSVAAALAALALPIESSNRNDARADEALVARVFAHEGADPDQRAVVERALARRLAVVLGGPGSGKTFTVLRLLAALAASGRVAPGRIRLATATGKAAQRLGQAIAEGRASLLAGLGTKRRGEGAWDEPLRRVLPLLPVEARTLHALLGARPLSTAVRHDAAHPIDCELLVVDEASMVDLPLFARMLAALPPGARLVLLGDPDQLASVEVGSVLAELSRPSDAGAAVPRVPSGSPQLSLFGIAPAPAASPLDDCVMRLHGNHRSSSESGLPRMLEAVREGDAARLRDTLAGGRGVEWLDRPAQRHDALARALTWYQPVLRTRDPAVALAAFEEARVLVALRSGPDGVDAWNEALLHGLGLSDARGALSVSLTPRRGTPLLITRNDANTGLSNGDVVLAWGPRARQPADHALARGPDGALRRIALDLLPPCESALAMTVHKAQGSEYRRVLVAPPFQPHPLVTREWLYTACSRARESLVLHAGEDALVRGLAASSRRVSGLADALGASVPA